MTTDCYDDVGVKVDPRWPSQLLSFSADHQPPGFEKNWDLKRRRCDERMLVIASILGSPDDKTTLTMMPNPDSMRVYLPETIRKRKWEDYTALMGKHWSSWYAPSSRGGKNFWVDVMGHHREDMPEEVLMGVPADCDVPPEQREMLEGVMKEFSMKRPAVPATKRYGYYCEPECHRPCTSGLPPLNEDQIQLVENRIKWYRQKRCVTWARSLIAAGVTRTLVSTACNHAWSEWYSDDVCALMKSTPTWRLIQRSGKLVSQRCISFLCGAHPRAGKTSPLSVLGVDVLRHILMLFGRFRCGFEVDGMEREPRQTNFEKSFDMSYNKWPPLNQYAVCAFGNFDIERSESFMALSSLTFAYALVYERGPWISLEDFVSGVEAGNVGNLQCFAFLQSGAYAYTPQERFMAIRLHETLFGVLPASEESKFSKCFTGDGSVLMADGSHKLVRYVRVGDHVKTESGIKRVSHVERKAINAEIPMCRVSGVCLTPGHPVFIEGTWKHPFEIVPVTAEFVSDLFNFELSGGPLSSDHSVWINGVHTWERLWNEDCGRVGTCG
ncbi:hypothetical protein Pelo_16849 [Pelomyxa schiedti]|nr:hypothetical protein Pelo_16849 [Pelomyxa schiedti]